MRDPAGCKEAIKLHWFCVTVSSVELVKRGIAGPDHPIHDPQMSPPMVAIRWIVDWN